MWVCAYILKKMTTLSRKLRHTAVASLTVFITARGGGTPFFNDLYCFVMSCKVL